VARLRLALRWPAGSAAALCSSLPAPTVCPGGHHPASPTRRRSGSARLNSGQLRAHAEPPTTTRRRPHNTPTVALNGRDGSCSVRPGAAAGAGAGYHLDDGHSTGTVTAVHPTGHRHRPTACRRALVWRTLSGSGSAAVSLRAPARAARPARAGARGGPRRSSASRRHSIADVPTCARCCLGRQPPGAGVRPEPLYSCACRRFSACLADESVQQRRLRRRLVVRHEPGVMTRSRAGRGSSALASGPPGLLASGQCRRIRAA